MHVCYQTKCNIANTRTNTTTCWRQWVWNWRLCIVICTWIIIYYNERTIVSRKLGMPTETEHTKVPSNSVVLETDQICLPVYQSIKYVNNINLYAMTFSQNWILNSSIFFYRIINSLLKFWVGNIALQYFFYVYVKWLFAIFPQGGLDGGRVVIWPKRTATVPVSTGAEKLAGEDQYYYLSICNFMK